MNENTKPDWALIANPTRARVLQHAEDQAMVVLESFIRPSGRGTALPLVNRRQTTSILFAHELTEYLELEARQGHYGSIAIFAPAPFLDELRGGLGKVTAMLLTTTCEMDITHIGAAELPKRVMRELELAFS
jgi:hypothetical protein